MVVVFGDFNEGNSRYDKVVERVSLKIYLFKYLWRVYCRLDVMLEVGNLV